MSKNLLIKKMCELEHVLYMLHNTVKMFLSYLTSLTDQHSR